MSKYPEHDRLAAVNDKTQTIGEFLEWAGSTGVLLCEIAPDDHFYPVGDTMTLLAEWAGIDRDRLEDEKRQMLDEMCRMNGVSE